MPKFKFSKLVRDKIVTNQIKSGAKPSYRSLDTANHKSELIKKIIEETSELKSAVSEEIADEIADIQQSVDDLIYIHGLKKSDVRQAQKIKRLKSGSFKKGIYIDYVELDPEDEWVKYYRKNSNRYPEIS